MLGGMGSGTPVLLAASQASLQAGSQTSFRSQGVIRISLQHRALQSCARANEKGVRARTAETSRAHAARPMMRTAISGGLKTSAPPRCGARSKRTGKPCRGAAMPNGRCKLHGGKSTGPRTPEGLERSRRANWKHGHFSREAKAERSAICATRSKGPVVPIRVGHFGPGLAMDTNCSDDAQGLV